MVMIKATSPGPIFFRQIRVGRGGRPFSIYKFRTMVESGPSALPKIGVGEPGSVTPVGRVLRRTKLDELPQLINVLAGTMNLVGPRPEIPEFVAKYSAEDQRIVLSVAPGLTDFASIRFRNEEVLLAAQKDPLAYYERVLMPAKLRYYRFYVRRASVGLDLYLIAQTILALGGDLLRRPRSQ
jgi:lipopolysaccharide/colanic/teichoic acid biosynthesis glycosyltransferase